jgi:hypothetical protein
VAKAHSSGANTKLGIVSSRSACRISCCTLRSRCHACSHRPCSARPLAIE